MQEFPRHFLDKFQNSRLRLLQTVVKVFMDPEQLNFCMILESRGIHDAES
jgi:hypothetical protein